MTEEQKRILELTEELDTAYDALIKLQKEYESLDNTAAKDYEQAQTLQQQNKQLIATLELYADDDFYNNLTDDVTANAKDVLQQIQGVEES